MSRRRALLLAAGVLVLLLVVQDASAADLSLSALTTWLGDQIKAVWGFFVTFMKDLVIFSIASALELVKVIVEALPPPTFLTDLAICTILSDAGPWAQWAIGTFRLAEGFAILTAALVFRLLRVVLTLFQWT